MYNVGAVKVTQEQKVFGMKLLLLGYARHGKDTVADILGEEFKLKFTSSSQFLNTNVIYPQLRSKYKYNTPEECFADRVNKREEWFNLIATYNASDPSRLAREILQENDLYVGMRRKEEVYATRNLFDSVWWIDRSQHVRPESTQSCTVQMNQADTVVDNNGSLADLKQRVIQLYNEQFA